MKKFICIATVLILLALGSCCASGRHIALQKGHIWLLGEGRYGIESPSKTVTIETLGNAIHEMASETELGKQKILKIHADYNTRLHYLEEVIDTASPLGFKAVQLSANGRHIQLRLIDRRREESHTLTFHLKVFWYKEGTTTRFPERNPFKEAFRDYTDRVSKGYGAPLIEGRMFIDSNRMPDLQALQEYLGELVKDHVPTMKYKSLPVTFITDEMVTVGFLFEIIEACQKAGISQFYFFAE